MSDAKFSTGAVRSADAANFSFTSLPMVGLLALARTAGEGAEKYGRFNYLQGMPLHDLMEHTFKHLVMYNAGDRSEPHLAHAAWGLLVAVQEEVMRPEAHVPHMLGPGCSITPAVQAHMDEQKPILAARRAENAEKVKAGEPDAFTWNLHDLPDVQKLRKQRDSANATAARLQAEPAAEPRHTAKEWNAIAEKSLAEEFKNRDVLNRANVAASKRLMDYIRNGPIVTFNGTPEAKKEITDALSKSRDTSAVEWLSDDEGFALIPQSKAKPRTESHVPIRHSHSPLAHASQNRKALRPYDDGETLSFGSNPAKSTPAGYFPRS